ANWTQELRVPVPNREMLTAAEFGTTLFPYVPDNVADKTSEPVGIPKVKKVPTSNVWPMALVGPLNCGRVLVIIESADAKFPPMTRTISAAAELRATLIVASHATTQMSQDASILAQRESATAKAAPDSFDFVTIQLRATVV